MDPMLKMIFEPEGLIQTLKENYKPRDSQMEAADKTLNAFRTKKHMLLEGPCGFGKTFAYLFPLFIHLSEHPAETAVIVTDGLQLQDQLYYKDLPFISDAFTKLWEGCQIDFALLKGKANFFCAKKLDSLMSTGKGSKYNNIVKAYQKTETGMLSELESKIPDNILWEFTCTRDGECRGGMCEYVEQCFFQKHKRKASLARIIITNYHILFSDWKLGPGTLLPFYNVLICDEAHKIPQIFRDFRESSVSVDTMFYLNADYLKLIGTYPSIAENIEAVDTDDLVTQFDITNQELELYFGTLSRLYFNDSAHGETRMLNENDMMARTANINSAFSGLTNSLRLLHQDILATIEDGYDDNDRKDFANKVGIILDKVSECGSIIKNCLKECTKDNVVYWMQKKADYKGQLESSRRFSLNYKPVAVNKDIKSTFLDRDDLSCIFTSATLTINDNLLYMKYNLGLKDFNVSRIIEHMGSSPFCLEKQQLWYIPEDIVSSKDATFKESLPGHIEKIIAACEGGALCLFTSNANKEFCYETLKPILLNKYGIMSMMQGEDTDVNITREFKDKIDSVLFASKKFMTGFDVPGDALRCIIIDKLPFDQQDDPVRVKRRGMYKENFKMFDIPDMIITLKQAVGRGVRSTYDKCVISVLDDRFLNSNYSNVFRTTFPGEIHRGDVSVIKEFLFGKWR